MIHKRWAILQDGTKLAHICQIHAVGAGLDYVANKTLCGKRYKEHYGESVAGDGRMVCRECASEAHQKGLVA